MLLIKSIFQIRVIIPLALGMLAFFAIAGPYILNPSNEEWLLNGGDGMQHHLGWQFFRNGAWEFPIGLNSEYGLFIPNSIVYTDSLPLLAIPFKLISIWLPEKFQYQGAWIFLCFILQAIFAWKLIGIYSNNISTLIFGTGIFIFSIPFLSQLPEQAPLFSHFLILAALYLNLNSQLKFKVSYWLILLALAVLIHFYLFAIVAVLWIADIADRFSLNKISFETLCKSVLSNIAIVLLIAWQVGYFSIRSASEWGYGNFKINVLGLINPGGWSYFFDSLYKPSSWWAEEPIYMGFGVLLLVLLLIINIKTLLNSIKSKFNTYFYLIIALLFFLLYSLSNQIEIGSLKLHIPMSETAIKYFGILRHAGRMFIPVYYVLILFICIQIDRLYKCKYRALILGICFLVQVLDLRAGIDKIRVTTFSQKLGNYNNSILKSSFWRDVPKLFKNIVILPGQHDPNPDFMAKFLAQEWRIFGRYAASNAMATNAVYLARYDSLSYVNSRKKLITEAVEGKFETNSIYILPKDQVMPVFCSTHGDSKPLLTMVDNFYVLIPNFYLNFLGKKEQTLEAIDNRYINNNLNTLLTSTKSNSFVLCGGWHREESWGSWSNGEISRIYMNLPKNGANFLRLELNAFIPPQEKFIKVKISINNDFTRTYILDKPTNNLLNIPIPIDANQRGYIVITFYSSNANSPKELGLSDDDRKISVGIVSAEFQ